MRTEDFKKHLKALQHDVHTLSAEALKTRVEALHADQKTDLEWDAADLVSFNDMVARQRWLIDETLACLAKASSVELEGFFSSHLAVNKDIFSGNDGKQAHRIALYDGTLGDCYLIGDLHGDVAAYSRLLEVTGFYDWAAQPSSGNKVVFLGDYVDRGNRQVELLERLMVLKLLFPEKVFIQRGNHDSGVIEEDGTFKVALRKPAEEPDSDYLLLLAEAWSKEAHRDAHQLHLKYLDLFFALNIVGFIQNGHEVVMAVHGGILRPELSAGDHEPSAYYPRLTSLSFITDETQQDTIGRTNIHNLMWSDPWEEPIDIATENGRFRFNKAHYDAFRGLIGFDHLVRGHQVFEPGIKTFFDDTLTSIFSSGVWGDGETGEAETTEVRAEASDTEKSKSSANPDTAYSHVTPLVLKVGGGKREVVRL